jgi:hypothetical protein
MSPPPVTSPEGEGGDLFAKLQGQIVVSELQDTSPPPPKYSHTPTPRPPPGRGESYWLLELWNVGQFLFLQDSPPPLTYPGGEEGGGLNWWIAGSGYKLTQPTCRERTHFSRQTGGGQGVYNCECGIDFKGTVRSKTRATQEEKVNTQHLKFTRAKHIG